MKRNHKLPWAWSQPSLEPQNLSLSLSVLGFLSVKWKWWQWLSPSGLIGRTTSNVWEKALAHNMHSGKNSLFTSFLETTSMMIVSAASKPIPKTDLHSRSLFSSHDVILEEVVQGPAAPGLFACDSVHLPHTGTNHHLGFHHPVSRDKSWRMEKEEGTSFSLSLSLFQNLRCVFYPFESTLPPPPSPLPGDWPSCTWVASLGLWLSVAFWSLPAESHFQWAAYLNQRPQLLLGGPFPQ